MRNSGGLAAMLVAAALTNVTVQARPRIGLVLEGGGALGFAHIGVIEYLEKQHIPVDLVVGTSMGGLVGGFYAVGKSPDEIRRLTSDIDWDAVLSGRTIFQDLNYRRKEDRVAFPNSLELGLKNKHLNIPAGLNPGHQTGLVIDRATLAYPDNLNFDDFPIPFRCVATDITLGREKVFDHGSIAQSLRATMAIPAVFSPVVIDGHAYTDGLAVDNLPVDVAKRAGADIVIAVYLDPGPVNPNEYESMFTVAARNLSIMVSANEMRNMEAADILVTAKLNGYTSASFTQGAEIIPKGYAAAQEKHRMLAALALNEAEWQAYTARRDAKIRREIPIPRFIEVIGHNADYSADLKKSLEGYVGKPIDPPALEASLNRFLGTGIMSSIGYTTAENKGEPGIDVKTYEKTYAPPFVNLGLSIDGSDPDNVLFGLAGRVTFMDLGGYRAEWRNDAFFGSTYGVRSEYYRPFAKKSRLFFAPRIYALSSPFTEYSGKDRLALYRVERLGFGADVGYTLGTRSEIRVGQDFFYFKAVRKIASEAIFNETERESLTGLQYRFYGTDNAQLPTRGLDLGFTAGHYKVLDIYPDFNQAELRASYFQPVSQKSSIFVAGSGGTAFHATVGDLGLQSFTLGGPFRLGAYGLNQLLGNEYFLFQGGYEQKLAPFSPLFGVGLYALGFFEAGKTYGIDNKVPAVPLDGTLALVGRTVIGPVFVGASVGNGGNRKWWFGVGRVF